MKKNNKLSNAIELLLIMQEIFGDDLDEHSAQNRPGKLKDAYYGCIADELRVTHDELHSYKICLGRNSTAKCKKALGLYDMFINSKLSAIQFAKRYLGKKKDYLSNKYGDLTFDDTYEYKGDVEKISDEMKALVMKDELRHAAKKEVRRSLPSVDRLLTAAQRRNLLVALFGYGNIDRAIEIFQKDPLVAERHLQLYNNDKGFYNYCKMYFSSGL